MNCIKWVCLTVLLFVLTCCAAFALADVEINEINFPDANFRTVVNGFDTDGNGTLSEEEIGNVTQIWTSGSISDLTGIEYFTALKYLRCFSNQLTSLDVSKNTALTELDCSFNQLTSLDVSGCTALDKLDCGSNQLTSLDVSKNTALGYLSCSFNQLTSLDVSENTALVTLICSSNQLTSLDVNTAMRFMNCSSNQLTSLDVSKCTALRHLECGSNQLTGLDVSKNTALTELNCSSNQLTSLDLTNNAALLREMAKYEPQTEEGVIYYGNKNGSYWSPLAFAVDSSVTVVTEGTTSDNVEINEENFPDEKFRQFISDFDTDGNGSLSEAEIGNVTRINCSSKSISDLTGIEHFTALTSLFCYSNQLTSLDVSQNTALDWLICHSNQLTSLDVSGCAALTSLSCGFNQLTSLDVSKNIALTRLHCNSNQLANLDVSLNTELELLYCYDNQLTSLDVSQNTALMYLACFDNQLTGLNLTNNKKLLEAAAGYGPKAVEGNIYFGYTYEDGSWLYYIAVDSSVTVLPEGTIPEIPAAGVEINESNFPDANFRAVVNGFDTDGNGSLSETEIGNVTSINCAEKNISDLTGIEYFTALTNLDCSMNFTLKTLDVSKNTALESLICFGANALTSLDVSGCIELKSLSCGDNLLTSLDVSKNTALEYLNCNFNQLTSLDLSKNTALTKLECSANRLTDLDVGGCTALTELKCRVNRLTSLDVSGCAALTKLDCYINQLTSLDVSKNTALTELNCSNNQLTNLDLTNNAMLLEEIAKYEPQTVYRIIYIGIKENEQVWSPLALAVDSSVSVLPAGTVPAAGVEINESNFPDANFRTVVNVFDTDGNGSLSEAEIGNETEINCRMKDISDLTGIEYFNALVELDCSFNRLTSLDVSQNTALTSLVCSQNQLTSFDVSQHPALTSLSCLHNQMTSLDVSGCTALTDLNCYNNQLSSLDVSGCTALTSLSCESNQLTSLDVSGCTALTSLSCASNQLTSLDVSECTALTSLQCTSNQLTSLDVSECTALTSLQCISNQLTSLDVSGCTALTSLDCSVNQLTSLDISGCTALTSLQCVSNQLTSLDVSGCTALTSLLCYSNSITEPCSFDLTALPGSFDVSKATDWQGGSIDGTVLTATEDVITYNYDCGNGKTMTVTLQIEHTMIPHEAKEPTCTELGWDAYEACGCGKNSTYVENAALGHDWHDPVYTWNENHTQLTATHVCKRNEEHTETETVDATSSAAEGPTCTDMGKTTYTSAEFTKEGFTAQTVTLTDIPALGHDLISHEAKEPTCTEVGWNAYDTCSRCDHTTYVEKAALGHNWGEVVYSWHGDKLTAERVCAKDETHTETETVGSVSEIISPTEETEGKLSRVSEAFENEAFEKQTTETIIPALKDMKVLYLPAGLLEIDEEAFADGTFTAVIVSDGCEIIRGKAFAGCADLIYVCVPASTVIEEDAFDEKVILDAIE